MFLGNSIQRSALILLTAVSLTGQSLLAGNPCVSTCCNDRPSAETEVKSCCSKQPSTQGRQRAGKRCGCCRHEAAEMKTRCQCCGRLPAPLMPAEAVKRNLVSSQRCDVDCCRISEATHTFRPGSTATVICNGSRAEQFGGTCVCFCVWRT